MTITISDPNLKPVDVAEMTNTPVSTLAWWRHTGAGPKWFRIGARRVFYKLSDVEAWLSEQYEAADAERVGA